MDDDWLISFDEAKKVTSSRSPSGRVGHQLSLRSLVDESSGDESSSTLSLLSPKTPATVGVVKRKKVPFVRVLEEITTSSPPTHLKTPTTILAAGHHSTSSDTSVGVTPTSLSSPLDSSVVDSTLPSRPKTQTDTQRQSHSLIGARVYTPTRVFSSAASTPHATSTSTSSPPSSPEKSKRPSVSHLARDAIQDLSNSFSGLSLFRQIPAQKPGFESPESSVRKRVTETKTIPTKAEAVAASKVLAFDAPQSPTQPLVVISKDTVAQVTHLLPSSLAPTASTTSKILQKRPTTRVPGVDVALAQAKPSASPVPAVPASKTVEEQPLPQVPVPGSKDTVVSATDLVLPSPAVPAATLTKTPEEQPARTSSVATIKDDVASATDFEPHVPIAPAAAVSKASEEHTNVSGSNHIQAASGASMAKAMTAVLHALSEVAAKPSKSTPITKVPEVHPLANTVWKTSGTGFDTSRLCSGTEVFVLPKTHELNPQGDDTPRLSLRTANEDKIFIKAALCSQSSYLRVACDNLPNKTKTHDVFTLKGVSDDLLRTFHSWMLAYNVNDRRAALYDISASALLHLWVLGDRLIMPLLQNDITTKLLKRTKDSAPNPADCGGSTIVSLGDIEYVYANTPFTSKLRFLVSSLYSYDYRALGKDRTPGKDFPHDFLYDLVRIYRTKTKRDEQWPPASVSKWHVGFEVGLVEHRERDPQTNSTWIMKSINALPKSQKWSFEELRLADYREQRAPFGGICTGV